MTDYSAFNSDSFDIYKWINNTIEAKRPNEDFDTFISSVSMKLQLLSQDCSDHNEEQMKLIMDRLPSVMKEVSLYASQLDNIKVEMRNLNTKITDTENNQCISTIAQLKNVYNNMTVCKKQLDSLTEWEQNVSNLESAVQNKDIETASGIIEQINSSFVLLEQLPYQDERKKTIISYKEKIVTYVKPLFESALKNTIVADLMKYKRIYEQLDELNYFIDTYAQKCNVDILNLWNVASTTEDKSQVFSIFWGSFYNYICELEETKNTLFESNNDLATSRVYTLAFSNLVQPINSFLVTCSIQIIPHMIDLTFHYIDILLSSIEDITYQQECVQSIFNIWIYYINKNYIEQEKTYFNTFIMELESHQPITVDLSEESIHNLCQYVMNYCRFMNQLQNHLYDILHRSIYITNGAALGYTVTLVNSLMETLSTKYTTVLNFIMKSINIQSKNLTIENFSWEIYRVSLCYNYVQDRILILIKEFSSEVTSFLSANKQSFIDAMTEGVSLNSLSSSSPSKNTTSNTTTNNTDNNNNTNNTDNNNTSVKSNFFVALCKDSSCKESLKSFLQLSSIPNSILFSRVITLYKSLLSQSFSFIYQLYAYPLINTFSIIPSLSIWSDISSSTHSTSLPSDYLMPLGEHLLKFVEQIEIAYNTISDMTTSHTQDSIPSQPSENHSDAAEISEDMLNNKDAIMSQDWLDLYEKQVEIDNKRIEQLFAIKIQYNTDKIINVNKTVDDYPYLLYINNNLYILIYIALANYCETFFTIQRIKFGGISQLSSDTKYLLNVLTAFDCNKPVILSDVISACQYNDNELSDAIGRLAPTDISQFNQILKKMAKFRGILGY